MHRFVFACCRPWSIVNIHYTVHIVVAKRRLGFFFVFVVLWCADGAHSWMVVATAARSTATGGIDPRDGCCESAMSSALAIEPGDASVARTRPDLSSRTTQLLVL